MPRHLDALQNKLAEYHLSKAERRNATKLTTVDDDYRFRRYGVVNEIFDRRVESRRDHPLKSHFLSFVRSDTQFF